MSTNKTEHYNLHSWTPEDDFLRTEINENFAAIDQQLAEKKNVVIGFYTGDGQPSQTIQVGAPILALLVENRWGSRHTTPYTRGGLVVAGKPAEILCTIEGECFHALHSDGSGGVNSSGGTYTYVAWVDTSEKEPSA